MTESAVIVEQYVSEVRSRVHELLKQPEFIGNIKFEFHIKHQNIGNMNIDTKESFKI